MPISIQQSGFRGEPTTPLDAAVKAMSYVHTVLEVMLEKNPIPDLNADSVLGQMIQTEYDFPGTYRSASSEDILGYQDGSDDASRSRLLFALIDSVVANYIRVNNAAEQGDHDLSWTYAIEVNYFSGMLGGFLLGYGRKGASKLAARAKKAADAKHAKSPLRSIRSKVKTAWEHRREELTGYGAAKNFIREMMNLYPDLKSEGTIRNWMSDWANGRS